MMKKIYAIIMIALMLLGGSLMGCSKKEKEVVSVEQYELAELPEKKSEIIQAYRKEVRERRNRFLSNFLYDEELEILSNYEGYRVVTEVSGVVSPGLWEEYMCYTVLYKENNYVVALYTTEEGQLRKKTLVTGEEQKLGNAHFDGDYETIESDEDHFLGYEPQSGKVEDWRFGEKRNDAQSLPSGAIYAGDSFFEGYIFRHGSDIYALKYNLAGDSKLGLIASGVKQVLVTDYRYNEKKWSQPLFLMEDGSVKVLVSERWEPELNPEALKAPLYEGGYK